MKNTITLFLIIFFGLTNISFAQISAGSQLLDLGMSGSTGYYTNSSQSYIENNSSSFNSAVSLGYGFFKHENIVSGILFGYNFAHSNGALVTDSTSRITSSNSIAGNIGYFKRYYKKVFSDMYVFIQPSVYYTLTNSFGVNNGTHYTGTFYHSLNATLACGFSYFISKRFAARATLNLGNFSGSFYTTSAVKSFSVNYGLLQGISLNNISVGLSYFIPTHLKGLGK